MAGNVKEWCYSDVYPVGKAKFGEVLGPGKALGEYVVQDADNQVKRKEYQTGPP